MIDFIAKLKRLCGYSLGCLLDAALPRLFERMVNRVQTRASCNIGFGAVPPLSLLGIAVCGSVAVGQTPKFVSSFPAATQLRANDWLDPFRLLIGPFDDVNRDREVDRRHNKRIEELYLPLFRIIYHPQITSFELTPDDTTVKVKSPSLSIVWNPSDGTIRSIAENMSKLRDFHSVQWHRFSIALNECTAFGFTWDRRYSPRGNAVFILVHSDGLNESAQRCIATVSLVSMGVLPTDYLKGAIRRNDDGRLQFNTHTSNCLSRRKLQVASDHVALLACLNRQ